MVWLQLKPWAKPEIDDLARFRDPHTSEVASIMVFVARGRAHNGLPRTLIRYIAVGVLNTCIGLGTIYLCLYALSLDDLRANLIGYLTGIVFSFVLNKYWTFSSLSAATPQFFKFLLVAGTAYLVNLAVVETLINALRVNHYVAHALGTGPYTLIGYLGSRYFAFREQPVAV